MTPSAPGLVFYQYHYCCYLNSPSEELFYLQPPLYSRYQLGLKLLLYERIMYAPCKEGRSFAGTVGSSLMRTRAYVSLYCLRQGLSIRFLLLAGGIHPPCSLTLTLLYVPPAGAEGKPSLPALGWGCLASYYYVVSEGA